MRLVLASALLVLARVPGIAIAAPQAQPAQPPVPGPDFYELGDYDLFPASGEPQPVHQAAPTARTPATVPTTTVPTMTAPSAPPSAPVVLPIPVRARAAPAARRSAAAGPPAAAGYEQGDVAAAREAAKALAVPARASAAALPTLPGAAERVPGYAGAALPSATLVDDPDALVAQGTAVAPASDAYRAVVDPTRVIVSTDRTSLARAIAVEGDPDAFVRGEALASGEGACRPLPAATGGEDSYEATCNIGTKLEHRAMACQPRLVADVTNTERYVYYGVDPDKTTYGFAARPVLLAHGCQPTGVVKQLCDAQIDLGVRSNDPIEDLRFCRGRGHGTATEMTCPVALAQREIPDHFNYIDGTIYLRKEGAQSVTLRRDEASCAVLEADATCRFEAETCSSSDPVTREVDGVSVTAPCSAWSRTYRCSTFEQASDCAALESRPACRFARETCLDVLPGGACQVRERTYRCPMPGGEMRGGPEFICGDDVYCIDGECEPITREASTEFKDALVGLHALGQANAEFDAAALTLFSGTRETCHKPVFGLIDCCAGKSSGALTAAAGLGAIAGGPVAIAALATPVLTTFMCSSAEKTLDIKDRMGFCHRVGPWCSDSFLGVCTSRSTAFCCLESKLSRILQEQGRVQLGLAWGAPKREQCQGFSVEQFARLDLSRMDFSEVYAEFVDAAKLPDELATAEAIQARIEDYYRRHAPR